eukprot:366125-Chlamydomonas_euryale.AAC.6
MARLVEDAPTRKKLRASWGEKESEGGQRGQGRDGCAARCTMRLQRVLAARIVKKAGSITHGSENNLYFAERLPSTLPNV